MSNLIINVNKDNFALEVEQSKVPVLLDFWAPWCGPCKALNPVIEQLAEKYQNKAKIVKVNVDEEKELAQKYKVRGIPTMLVIQDGEMKENVSSLRTLGALSTALDGLMSGDSLDHIVQSNLDDPDMLGEFLSLDDQALISKVLKERPELVTSPLDEHGFMPLTFAIHSQKDWLVELLESLGAVPTLANLIALGRTDDFMTEIAGLSAEQVVEKSGVPAEELYYSVLLNPEWLELCDQIIPADFDFNMKDKDGIHHLLFFYGIAKRPIEVLQYAVKRGLDVTVDYQGYTALHTSLSNLDTTKFLLAQGCNPNSRDQRGMTPLDYVKQKVADNPDMQPVLDHLSSL